MFTFLWHDLWARWFGTSAQGSWQGTRQRRQARRRGPPPSSRCRPRLQLEYLEERTLPAAYSVIDLGTLGGPTSEAESINNSGQIVGYSDTSSATQHAFWYAQGTGMHDLGTLGGLNSFATGINDAGEIVGVSDTAVNSYGGHPQRAFLYSNGSMVDLGVLGDQDPSVTFNETSAAIAINNAGQVVGISQNSETFLYSAGTMLPVDSISIDYSFIYEVNHAINDSGEIIGDVLAGQPGVYSNGGVVNLVGTLGVGTVERSINNSGSIVGYIYTPGGDSHAFLYTDDTAAGPTMVDLGTLGGGTSIATGINKSDQVVGQAQTADGFLHAVVYTDGTMRDLNDLIPADSGWTLSSASAINDRGQIVGYGWNAKGEEHAFLLNPGPVPKKVEPKPDGSLVVTYEVIERLPAGEKVPISVYWATGAQGSNALSKNPPYGQATGPDDALDTYMVDSSKGPGTYKFEVKPDELLTAPHAATYLLVVADPKDTFAGNSYAGAILPVAAHLGDLSTAQVEKLLPGGGKFAAPLSATMSKFGVASLEQRAMFMGQLAVESANLTKWVEDRSRSWCIDHYWTHRFRKWPKSGASASVNSSDIVFRVKVSGANPPKEKVFDLEWVPGAATSPATPSAGAAFAPVSFTRSGNYYTYIFPGAVPPDTGTLYAHLLVIDDATKRVKIDVVNKLGNWSPDDAYDFRGGGPIQLTGRHNYQLFANYENTPEVMFTSNGKSPAEQLGDQANPQLGFDAAGYYWVFLAVGGNLNTKADAFAWQPYDPFTLAISIGVNGQPKPGEIPKGYQDRRENYLRIRVKLLDKDL
jgi:probable HAF family extracellular repeat protein